MRQIVVSGGNLTAFCIRVMDYERIGWGTSTDATGTSDEHYHITMRISEYGFARIKMIAAFLLVKELVTKRGGNPLYYLCSVDKSITKI
jgi:hypothetical protein